MINYQVRRVVSIIFLPLTLSKIELLVPTPAQRLLALHFSFTPSNVGSVRAFKIRNQLGRFNPEFQAQQEAEKLAKVFHSVHWCFWIHSYVCACWHISGTDHHDVRWL